MFTREITTLMKWSSHAFPKPCEVREKAPSDWLHLFPNQLQSGGIPKVPEMYIAHLCNVQICTLYWVLDYQSSRGAHNRTEATSLRGKKKINREITIYLAYCAEKFPNNKTKITKHSNKKAFSPHPQAFSSSNTSQIKAHNIFQNIENPLGEGFS